MDLLSLFLLWTYLKHLIQWIVMLFSILLIDIGSCQGISLFCYKTGLIYVMLVFAGEAGEVIILYLVLCYSLLAGVFIDTSASACELGTCYRQFCLQFNLFIWMFLIVRLRSSGFGCYLFGAYLFWLPNVCRCHIIVSSSCIGYET